MDHDINRQLQTLDVPDFSRNIHCLFGLPFDLVTVEQAVGRVMSAAREGQRCVLSTPNLNIAVAAQTDPAFRASLIRSNLCVVDGMSVVWSGRYLGVPFSERVPGSGLFERLCCLPPGQPQLKVYLFGGGEGIAAQAAHALNSMGGSVCCVGYASPGFGSVASMSSPEILNAINASGADFLLVALGAQKGQAWIEHNLPHLTPPVVSYLGAVINFIAGTVRRAPRWMQRSGLEWLWRIIQEKGLCSRYWNDGRLALGLFCRNVLPGLIFQAQRGRRAADEPATMDVQETADEVRFLLGGAWTSPTQTRLRGALNRHADTSKWLHLDVRHVTSIGSGFAGLMIMLRRYRLDRGHTWSMEQVTPGVLAQLKMYCATDLLEAGEAGA